MYSNVINQVFQFSHYLLAFILLFIVYPYFLFKKKQEPVADSIIRNFLKMSLVVIIAGYILVLIKLFEFIGLLLLFISIFAFNYRLRTSSEEINKRVNGINAYMYDLADNRVNLKKGMKSFISTRFFNIRKAATGFRNNIYKIIGYILVLTVFIYSAWFRFYDAFINSAPSMSDGAVTLSWIKYITERKLFVDGIYPQGFSIYMATLLKFSYIDSLYILKYSGPLNEVLILIGLYYIVLRLTGRKLPAIAAVVVYGLMYKYLPGEFQRQAATNSQEFGFVFILPSLYFFYRYLENGDKNDLIGAFCGLASSGLVHLIAFAFAGLGLALLTFIYVIFNLGSKLKRIIGCIAAGILSIITAAMPAAIGHYIVGIGYYGSSADYAQSTAANIPFRVLGTREHIVLILIGIIFSYTIFLLLKKAKGAKGWLFISLYSATAFVLYYAGGALTKMEVIDNRSPELISMLIPVLAGTSLYIASSIFKVVRLQSIIETSAIIAAIAVIFIYIEPEPIIPYKMLRNIEVNKYLQISTKFLPTDWLFVSYDDMTAIVRGKGYHLMADDFLSRYDPDKKFLMDKKTGKLNKTPYVFIFYEKNIFVDQVESATYTTKKKQLYYSKLREWIRDHERKFSNISLYYSDKDICIYEIDQSKLNRNNDAIWGKK